MELGSSFIQAMSTSGRCKDALKCALEFVNYLAKTEAQHNVVPTGGWLYHFVELRQLTV